MISAVPYPSINFWASKLQILLIWGAQTEPGFWKHYRILHNIYLQHVYFKFKFKRQRVER